MTLVYPMFTLVVVTFVVGMLTAYVRIKAAYSGEVNPKYFKLMSKYDVPDKVVKFGRNFDNLFEVPVLFYAVCLCALFLHIESMLMLVLAWLFVALRVVHSLIHLTYNHPFHRFAGFALSFVCVVMMWVDVVIHV